MKFYKKNDKGFTLIEVMVVIVIIGIMSSIAIFVSRDARLSARDAKIKSELDSFRKHAELTRQINGGNYTFICANNALLSSINDNTTELECFFEGGQTYAVSAVLNKNPAESFCVDSEGYAGPGVADIDFAGNFYCN